MNYKPPYIVVQVDNTVTTTLHNLGIDIADRMEAGYIPIGGLTVHHHKYMQAMVLREAVVDSGDVAMAMLIESFHSLAEAITRLTEEKRGPTDPS